jgi:hypothetical protein
MGWQPSDQAEAVDRSVRWHLAHPPAHPDTDFSADARALGTPMRAPGGSDALGHLRRQRWLAFERDRGVGDGWGIDHRARLIALTKRHA